MLRGVEIVECPGNGTRYHLLIAHSCDGWVVTWPDTGTVCLWWEDSSPHGHLACRGGRATHADLVAMCPIVARAIRELG